MLILGIGMGNLFVPLTVTAVSGVANTDAGLASALLNVGQQVGGALGLSVMTTVFGTSARNYVINHGHELQNQLSQAVGGDRQLAGSIGSKLGTGTNGLQPEDIKKLVASVPQDHQNAVASFFAGAYHQFTRELLAHASG